MPPYRPIALLFFQNRAICSYFVLKTLFEIEISENKISLEILIIILSFKVNHKISFHDIVTL